MSKSIDCASDEAKEAVAHVGTEKTADSTDNDKYKGTDVAKRFDGILFLGKVTSPSEEVERLDGEIETAWHVKYTDSDEEDLNEKELLDGRARYKQDERWRQLKGKGHVARKREAKNGRAVDDDADIRRPPPKRPRTITSNSEGADPPGWHEDGGSSRSKTSKDPPGRYRDDARDYS